MREDFYEQWFAKFTNAETSSNAKLCRAAKDAEDGLIDAGDGGGSSRESQDHMKVNRAGTEQSFFSPRRQGTFHLRVFKK